MEISQLTITKLLVIVIDIKRKTMNGPERVYLVHRSLVQADGNETVSICRPKGQTLFVSNSYRQIKAIINYSKVERFESGKCGQPLDKVLTSTYSQSLNDAQHVSLI